MLGSKGQGLLRFRTSVAQKTRVRRLDLALVCAKRPDVGLGCVECSLVCTAGHIPPQAASQARELC